MELPSSLNELIKLGFSASNLAQIGRKNTFDAEDYMQLKMFSQLSAKDLEEVKK